MTNIEDFLKKFEPYEEPYPVGVLLPEIDISDEDREKFEAKDVKSNAEFLRAICRKRYFEMGLHEKPNAKEYQQRIKMELDIFEELGFVDYVLLNWDIIGRAKDRGIPVGRGRGSAAGSLVMYLLKVTGIDSLKHELFFERFVSKSRARKIEHKGTTYLDGSLLPDVDSDIAFDRRHEVVKYIEEAYARKTSKILTINTLTGKLCMKECAKLIAEVSEADANSISGTIPKHHGKVAKLKDALQESESFKRKVEDLPDIVLKIAMKLEGLNKNFGVHPAGIAITNQLIEDIMPVQLTGDGELISGFDMNAVAEIAVKFDVLGLRTLTVVDDCCKQLGIDMDTIDPEDPSIYSYLQDFQNPQGCFQIEADTNFRVCQEVRPMNIEHLSAVLALARPGALDYVEDFVRYRDTGNAESRHPIFDDVLDYTGSIPLYQEQLMKMATKVGFTLDEAEQLRRIVGKKKVDQMPLWKEKIEEKVKENNLDKEVGDILWKVAEDSANYSFNKCIFEEETVELECGSRCMLKDVKIGDMIKAYDTKSGMTHYVEVLDIMKNQKNLVEVTLESGRSISASLDHKFLTKESGMQKLKDIISNDWSIANE